MTRFVRKLADFLTTLLLVTVVTFLTFQLLPGNPALAILGPEAEDAQIAELEAQLGLDQSIPVRYVNWLKGAATGNLGYSYKYRQPVSEIIRGGLKTTAKLAVTALFFTIFIGLFFGIFFARTRNNLFIKPLSYVSQLWVSIPSFCTALILILIFTVLLKLLPSVGYSSPVSLILPGLSIALGSGSILCRYIKTSIETELKQDYVRTARSKGLTENQIITRHVLRNALIPSITTLGLIAAEILGGSIIIENVFSLPGIGRLITASISSRDFPLIQGLTLYLAFMTLTVNLLVDFLYNLTDPRTRRLNNEKVLSK